MQDRDNILLMALGKNLLDFTVLGSPYDFLLDLSISAISHDLVRFVLQNLSFKVVTQAF